MFGGVGDWKALLYVWNIKVQGLSSGSLLCREVLVVILRFILPRKFSPV